ncbi:MAG: HEAT repeat domain-containing protein [Bacteriovorax sp.]|nr:HEAT repeat domain-containing protein [Bacteriovorax sp.]
MSTESNDSRPSQTQKKILENPFVGSLVVPIAIVLVGALILFGVTKMLSAERSYKDLVNEIQSRTFGNKWVAAYELSKQINSSQIPVEEYPWLIENLTTAYKDSVDPRTRGFIIAALGALKSELTLPTLQLALQDQETDVKFHAVVSLANLPKGIKFDWTSTIELLKSPEAILRQASTLALATHQVSEAKEAIHPLLQDESRVVRYAAATALIAYKDEAGIDLLKEILMTPYPLKEARVIPPALDVRQISDLKLSVLITLAKYDWSILNNTVLEVANKDDNISVATKAKEVLNILKK